MASIETLSSKSKDEDENFSSIKKFLIENNLDIKNTKDFRYLLSFTLRSGINNSLNYLLKFLIKHVNSENEHIFYEYLFQSCELGKINNVKILLENGFNVNCQNIMGETPLHIAIVKRNIELIKLLIKYEPDTTLCTIKNNSTVMDYAEISNDNQIITLINKLNFINNKKIIKSEIADYINQNMAIVNSSSDSSVSKINSIKNNSNNINIFSSNNIKDKNFYEIQNYNGEKISVLTNDDFMNNSPKQSKKITKPQNIKKYISNKNSYTSKNNILPKPSFFEYYDKQQSISSIILENESDFSENSCISEKLLSSNNLNIITNDNLDNNLYKKRHMTEDCFFNTNLNITKNTTEECHSFTTPLKKDDKLHINGNLSLNSYQQQSLTTSNTFNNENFEVNNNSKKSSIIEEKIAELKKFIQEINLPIEYVNKFMDNGFDDLEVLLYQTKNGIALSNQNLKDIGIKLAGERAKIIIHLEEKAGILKYEIEKEKVYSNEKISGVDNSLYKFLASMNLEEYIKKFIKNGYYTGELLYMQMITKQPITEEILKNDIGINKIGHVKRLINSLTINSKNYLKKLNRKGNDVQKLKSIVFEGNPYLKSCNVCIVF